MTDSSYFKNRNVSGILLRVCIYCTKFHRVSLSSWLEIICMMQNLHCPFCCTSFCLTFLSKSHNIHPKCQSHKDKKTFIPVSIQMQEPMFTPQLKGPVAACITRALNRKVRGECKFSVQMQWFSFSSSFNLFFVLPVHSPSYLKTKFTVRLSKNNAGKENLTGDRNRLNTTKKKAWFTIT